MNVNIVERHCHVGRMREIVMWTTASKTKRPSAQKRPTLRLHRQHRQQQVLQEEERRARAVQAARQEAVRAAAVRSIAAVEKALEARVVEASLRSEAARQHRAAGDTAREVEYMAALAAAVGAMVPVEQRHVRPAALTAAVQQYWEEFEQCEGG